MFIIHLITSFSFIKEVRKSFGISADVSAPSVQHRFSARCPVSDLQSPCTWSENTVRGQEHLQCRAIP